jgi:YcaO-like protein with predicted kinase domain
MGSLSAVDRFRAALPPGEVGDFDISAVDRIGIPVVAADYTGDYTGPQPLRSGGVGYGETLDRARIGAYGELAESLLLHVHLGTFTPHRASYHELRAQIGDHGVVDPRALVLPAGTVVHDEQPRDWLPAIRWRTGETVLLPAEFCANAPEDLPWQDPAERLITVITNGAGAGDTAERAVAHGLLELLQRDGNGTAFRALDRGEVLELDDVRDPVTRSVLARLREAGIEPLAKLASTQFGMADVHVVGLETDPDADPLVLTACGEAAHPDREVALRKALLEYISSRARKVFSHAPLQRLRPFTPASYWRRELASPMPPQEPRAMAAMRAWSRCSAAELAALLEPVVLSRRSSSPFSALPTVAPGTLDDPPALLAELLRRLDGFDVLVVLAPSNGAVAVKVIVPGLEVETMSYDRIGARGVAKLLERDPDDIGGGLVGLGPPPHEGAASVVLTAEGRERLGGDAWLDRSTVERIVGPLYPLYREPTRHAFARCPETADPVPAEAGV